eukprot:602822-Hanusia_phi.AAC.2
MPHLAAVCRGQPPAVITNLKGITVPRAPTVNRQPGSLQRSAGDNEPESTWQQTRKPGPSLQRDTVDKGCRHRGMTVQNDFQSSITFELSLAVDQAPGLSPSEEETGVNRDPRVYPTLGKFVKLATVNRTVSEGGSLMAEDHLQSSQ